MSNADELRKLAEVAAELVDDIQGQQHREAASFRDGYSLGLLAGKDVGYADAEADMEAAWAPVAEGVRRLGRTLTRNELELRRWDGRREDFGKPRPADHPGGPKVWEGSFVQGVRQAVRDGRIGGAA